jgi:hypothetical protein
MSLLSNSLIHVKHPPFGTKHIANYTISGNIVEFEYVNGGMDMLLPNKATFYNFLNQKRISLKAANIYSINSNGLGRIYMAENEKTTLLGVSGEIGCGKSTVVDYIAKNHGFIEYMFAKPLKDIALILGFEEHQVYGSQEQKLEINNFWGITGRRFMQVFGSEVCRDHLPRMLPDMNLNGVTIWARLFEKYLFDNKYRNIAVSDVRFPDESNIIKKYGGITIRIERQTNNRTHAYSQHKSETQQLLTNVVVYNNGSLNDLYNKIDRLFVEIKNGNVNADTYGIVL